MKYFILGVQGNPKHGIAYSVYTYRHAMEPAKAKIEWDKVKNRKDGRVKCYLVHEDKIDQFYEKVAEINQRMYKELETRKRGTELHNYAVMIYNNMT